MEESKLFSITKDWLVHRNEFYSINPNDDLSDVYKYTYLYSQEDLLHLQKGEYHLDLGWYGYDCLDNPLTGFMLVLFRGNDWNNCELFELLRSQSYDEINNWIKQIFELVNSDFYTDKTGFKIAKNTNEENFIGQHFRYSVSRNVNELIK